MAKFLARAAPVIITDCPLARQLVDTWSVPHLAETFDRTEQLQVHFAPRARRLESTSFARIYGDGLGEGGVRLMNFGEFAMAACNASAGCGHYLAAPILRNASAASQRDPRHSSSKVGAIDLDDLDDLDDDLEAEYDEAEPSRQEMSIEPCVPRGVAAEAMQGIDWSWLARVLSAVGTADEMRFDMAQLWAGDGNGATPLHFDALHNLFAQIGGRKRVVLYPPSESFRVYPYPVGHIRDNFAMADPASPDVSRFPALAHARGLEGILGPGDVLFLPRYYWHHVQQLGEEGGVEGAVDADTVDGDADADAVDGDADADAVDGDADADAVEGGVEGSAVEGGVEGGGADGAAAGGGEGGGQGGGQGGGPSWNLSINFWFGLKGTGAFQREMWTAARQLPSDETVAAAEAAAAASAAAASAASATVMAATTTVEIEARVAAKAADAELEALLCDEGQAVRALLAARHVEGCTQEWLGTAAAAGEFLTKLASGHVASWAEGSAARRHATRTRAELIALLGSASLANALLRAMTRDGRLHPGLAPSVGERVVNSEAGQISPLEEYHEALRCLPASPR